LAISAWQWICLSAAFLFALLVGVWTVTVPTGETSLLVGLKKDSCRRTCTPHLSLNRF